MAGAPQNQGQSSVAHLGAAHRHSLKTSQSEVEEAKRRRTADPSMVSLHGEAQSLVGAVEEYRLLPDQIVPSGVAT